MSFEQEWDDHKANGNAESPSMQLNGYNAENRSATPADLIVHQDDLGLVGNDAYALHSQFHKWGDINNAGRDRSESGSTARAARELSRSDFQLGPALRKASKIWDSQRKTLLQGCAHISNHLNYTKKSHAEDEAKIAESMPDSLSVSAIYKYIR